MGDIKSRLQDIEGEASKLKELEQSITPQIDMQEGYFSHYDILILTNSSSKILKKLTLAPYTLVMLTTDQLPKKYITYSALVAPLTE